MRSFSSAVDTVLASDSVEFFYLIQLDFAVSYYLTSYSHDILFDGNVYTANSGVFEIESPEFSRVVDREAFRVAALDLDNVFTNEVQQNVIGSNITVRAGFIDANGEPLLNPEDTILIYQGYVDSPSITNDWESKIVTFEGSSPLADLDQINSFVTSKRNMRDVDATDTSFDKIFEDSEVSIKWGKIK